MGEYAKHNGHEVKIGTCEDMYYLRADQRFRVCAISGNVDPSNPEHQKHIRFRFPFPDEDGTAPGAFGNYGRAVGVHGLTVPEGVKHDSVQFTAPAGYVLSIPCPESGQKIEGLTVHRNGFSGAVRIVQQGFRNGNLALICECGGCGAKYNLGTIEDARPVIEACRERAAEEEREHKGSGAWWEKVAYRIESGYAEVGKAAVS